ncbi:hypothetical protein HRED_00180 [Candidatus Haloredivivus sp. G17]|jgi:hypothetical protein|nr:hypothetical protein HRED_00180 [Candidatus Haloredivivus sp. G17]
MSLDDLTERFDSLETRDVAEKRLEMMKILEGLLNQIIDFEGSEVEKLEELEEKNGYLYKLSQDFLLSSSTMEKEQKLEKILNYVEKKDYT